MRAARRQGSHSWFLGAWVEIAHLAIFYSMACWSQPEQLTAHSGVRVGRPLLGYDARIAARNCRRNWTALTSASQSGCQIGRDVERIGHHQRDMTSHAGKVFYVGDNTFSRHPADLSADKLDCDHERCCQKNRPQQAIAKLRSGSEISRDARRIVVGGSRDEPGSEQPQQIIRTPIGCLLSSVSEEFGERMSACNAIRVVTSASDAA
jgi:hypothetical protein